MEGAMNKALTAPIRGAKALGEMVFSRWPNRIWHAAVGRGSWRVRREVGDGTGSSAVMACLNWITSTFPEAPPMLWKIGDKGEEEQDPKHELLRLLVKPNDFYSGEDLWSATLVDYHASGNAYWLLIGWQNRPGVAELWWTPSSTMEAFGDEDELITHYIYRPGDGKEVRVETDEVVHFRYGIDPDDQKYGRSPLASVLREILTDEEASQYTSNILRNMGVPGVVISPDDPDVVPGETELEETKEIIRTQFTGERRGEPLVLNGPTRVQQFGFSPQQMDLRTLRRLPEERITAVLGIPAIVAGLGAGLDRSTFANMKEAREAAYEGKIIPLQRNLASTVRFQLLDKFESDPWAWRFGFDLAVVRVLQEDQDNLVKRMDTAVQGGWATRADARRAIGLEVEDKKDDVFYIPVSKEVVPRDADPPDPDAEPEPVSDEVEPPDPSEEDDDAQPPGENDTD